MMDAYLEIYFQKEYNKQETMKQICGYINLNFDYILRKVTKSKLIRFVWFRVLKPAQELWTSYISFNYTFSRKT